MRLYHFLKKEWGVEALLNKRLKLAIIDKLNDPFEHIGIDIRDRVLRRWLINFRKSLARKQGIISLSKTWTNPLMWAHYSENHTGICLGFDVPDDYPIQVTYKKQRLDYNIETLKKIVTEKRYSKIIELMATKYSCWSYEEEYRIYAYLRESVNGLFFKPFDETLQLKQLILGSNGKFTEEGIKTLTAGYPGLEIIKARAGFKDFEMVPQRDPNRIYLSNEVDAQFGSEPKKTLKFSPKQAI